MLLYRIQIRRIRVSRDARPGLGGSGEFCAILPCSQWVLSSQHTHVFTSRGRTSELLCLEFVNTLKLLSCVYVYMFCVCVWVYTSVPWCAWRSEDSLRESVLFHIYVGWVARFIEQALLPIEPSHRLSPEILFKPGFSVERCS